MATFKTRGIGRIQEERSFTNPHVRFIRKNGKIIPLVNKKRIGQDVSAAGTSVATKGVAVLAAGFAAKKLGIAKKIPKFSISGGAVKYKATDTRNKRLGKALTNGLYKSGKLAISATGSVLRNSKKIGFGLLGLGVAGKLIGDEVQMRSPLGKDYFFTKDQHGRGA